VWIYTRSNGLWVQQGGKLIGSGAVGVFVALSGDGNPAIVGGYGDDSFTGAAWVYKVTELSDRAPLPYHGSHDVGTMMS
jgi:hypothetical protein